MTLETREVSGLEYLDLVTALLQRARVASPLGGDLEAADLQWWWRRDQHHEPARQRFWFDGNAPIAAFVMTDWGERLSCDLISADDDACPVTEVVWPAALALIETTAGRTVELTVRDDDVELAEVATGAGFSSSDDVTVSTWMNSARRPAISPLPEGFELVARSERLGEPHHMIKRNGDQVAERLAECTLYRPDLDLMVSSPAGELAAYSLFWADLVTGVGMVEPMRTEDGFKQMGLGRHLLTAGMDRLSARGCSRLKVCYVEGNDAARRLYLGAGFRRCYRSRIFKRASQALDR